MTLRQPYEDAVLVIEDIAMIRAGDSRRSALVRGVLKRAIDEARASGSGRIGTTHFLLALLSLRRPDPAAGLLEAVGVDPAGVRRRLGGPAGGGVA